MGMHAPDDFSQRANQLYMNLTSGEPVQLTHFTGDRQALASALARAHNTSRFGDQGQTNAQFLNLGVGESAILDALTNTRGYDGPDGWGHWAGRHVGTWWKSDAHFQDNARWHAPTVIGGGYDFQRVVFRRSSREFGWNQSRAGVQYVWGWDPKGGTAGYQIHLGVTLDVADSHHAIVWITPAEAFLEIVGHGKRTSAGLLGCGQWAVH